MTQQQESQLLSLYMETEFKKRAYEEANDRLDLFIRRNCKNSLLDIRLVERELPVEKKTEVPEPTNRKSKV